MVRGSRPLGAAGELTVHDALRFQQMIYDVPPDRFRQSMAELTEMLHLEPLLQRQIRALSLGERMRAGLAWSLLYRPRVLFLDEPTVGLDVTVTTQMRRFIAEYSQRVGAAILLTSHHMADVETLCRRIVLIDRGKLLYDGELAELSARLAPYKLLNVRVAGAERPDWDHYGTVVSREEGGARLQIRREDIPAITAQVLADLPVADLTIEEPPLESVIDQVYRQGLVA
jgi:ABC-2 type transport system ATP-binding protein